MIGRWCVTAFGIVDRNEAHRTPAAKAPTGSVAKIRRTTKWPDEQDQAAMPNKLLTNITWPITSPFATHLALPFLTISIASIPRKVRHAVSSEA
jgi:hypothetical protein